MKEILAWSIIAAILSIAPSAMAGGVKAPKSLCLNLSSSAPNHRLAFKSSGTILDANGKIKTYTVTGRDGYGVIDGSAHIIPGTTVLQAAYTGMHGQANGTRSTYELFYDLGTADGDIHIRTDFSNGVISVSNQTVEETDCSEGAVSLPSGE